MRLSSPTNPRIKQIRRLGQRKARRETGLYFVEGIRLVTEAIQLKADIETLIVAPELLTSDFGRDMVQTGTASGFDCLEVTGEVFRSLSQKEGPQGLGAVIQQRWDTLENITIADSLGWVVLEAVQNPGNLGSILRTCDAVGCAGVILLGDTTDPYDPAAVRGSMGAIFSQRLIRTDFPTFSTWKPQQKSLMIGTSDAAPLDYQAIRYQPPVLLCMGNEQHGLSAEYQVLCDQTVQIPMVGRSDSLNLAVATSVVLYEIFNQQREHRSHR